MTPDLPDYQPLWPETVLFWGAGATRALQLRTTAELGQAVFHLAAGEGSLSKRVSDEFSLDHFAASVTDLLTVLSGADGRAALERFLPGLTYREQRHRQAELRQNYDFATLCQLVRTCPGHTPAAFRLQDLFTLIDMHLDCRHGFYAPASDDRQRQFIAPERLLPARNVLVMLINLLHYHDFSCSLSGDQEILAVYAAFARTLAGMMLCEGQRLAKDGRYVERSYYLLSYAIISMNWDPLLLWLLDNAYNEANVREFPDQRLFHDFGHLIGLRMINGNHPGAWYPVNEAVVQRLNDPSYGGRSLFRIGKYYFPHGCSSWRECPNCGKLTLYLGNDRDPYSPSLYPPPLAGTLSALWRQAQSGQEQRAHARGMFDVLHCVHCGTVTEARHIPLVMQSGLRGRRPAFLEEIHHEIRICLENARHVLFMGYTLPPDDIMYRSLLAARQKRGTDGQPFCSVAVGADESAPDAWLTGRELAAYLASHEGTAFFRTVQAAQAIFPPEKVRGYARGIPAVFLDASGHVTPETVTDLLYPGGLPYRRPDRCKMS